MKKRIGTLLLALGATMAVLAPVASANGKKHDGKHARMVCGTVDISSTAASLVITTMKHGNVTITNAGTPPVDTAAFLAASPAASVCATVTRIKAADGTRSLALVSIAALVPKVKPYASVEARGAVTLGTGTVTVDTVVFAVPSTVTLPVGLMNGDIVSVRGVVATATSTTIDLTRIRVRGASSHRKGGKGEHGQHGDQGESGQHGDQGEGGGNGSTTSSVSVRGPVSAVSATSLTVAGLVTFAIPTTVTVDTTRVIVGARVCARGAFDGTTLSLVKVRVKA